MRQVSVGTLYEENQARLGLAWVAGQQGGNRVLTGETELKPGDRIALNLRLPVQRVPMHVAVARVRWVREHLFGLEFTRLSPTHEWRLWKFIEPFSMPAKADR